MEHEALDVRARLDSLLRTVTRNPQTQEVLSSDGDVPPHFLENNGISLPRHQFDITGNSAANNSNLDPPFLFAPCPLDLFQKHPIDTSDFLDPKFAKAALYYAKFKENSLVLRRVRFTTSYLERWAGGGGLSRAGTLPEFLTLRELRGLVHVRGRHALYAGFPFSNHIGHQYEARVSEYDSQRFGGSKPHLVLLSEVPDIGHEGSILYGELALLLTAMRNRAYQPAMFKYPNSDDESEIDVPSNGGFLFEHERRFPVLMVSVIGMQHARISYACMDGLNVVIRQSRIWSLEEKDEEVLDFLAGMLLSEPLDENQVEGLAQQLGSTSVSQEKESDGYVLVDLFEGGVP